MAIAITQTSATTKEVPKTRNVYDNLDNLKSVVHYDSNNNVDHVLKTSNNASGKSLETKKLQQIQVDVVESPSNITASSATLNARVYKNDNSKVRETGFVVWAGDDFESVVGKTEYSNVIATPVILKGNFTKAISNLSDATIYNYRAYVKHEYGTNYSKVYQFTTIASNLVFAIAGNKFSGPAPLTVSLSAINAGSGVASYAWNLTGGQTPDFTTQTVEYTYLSAGTFTARASAIMDSGVIKTATRQIVATAVTNYTAEWSNVLASSYGNNIVGAYDFRNLANTSLKNGLRAFWKLDDLIDSSGNGNDLTNDGSVTFDSGKIGNAATGNGSNYLYTPIQLNLSTEPHTFSFWINLQSFSGNVAIVPIGKYPGLSINMQGSGSDNRIRLDDFTQASSYSSVSALPFNTWTHICITIDADKNVKTYFNGELDAGTGTTNISDISELQLFSSFSFHNFGGQLDAVGVWNRILTDEEIAILYNAGAGTENINTVDAIVGPDLSLVGTTQIESLSGDGSYNDVSLLLDMKDATSPTDFQDKSTNAFTVTANGSTQIASITGVGSPAAYFNGNDYLVIGESSEFNLGDGSNYTVEMWININSFQGQADAPRLISFETNSTAWGLLIDTNNSNGDLIWNNYGTSEGSMYAYGAITLNTWTHVALIKNGSRVSLYVNGIEMDFKTDTNAMPNGNARITLGGSTIQYSYQEFYGYLDNIRITKGVARYTSNFIPPSGPLPTTSDPSYANVSLLLNMNSVGITFTDQSDNNFTVTRNGTPAITSDAPAFSRGNFAVFDGNVANYLSLNSGQNFNFSNDFTIEGWFLFKQNDVGYQPLISSYVDNDQTGWALITETWNGLAFYGSQDNSWQSALATNYVPPVGQWLHIAVSRVNGLLQMFVNGESVDSASGDTTNIASGNTVAIGEYTYFPGGELTFDGYIDDVRITKGVGRYANNFTPPQSLPTEVGEIVGLKFIPSPAYAASNETISVTYPHTLVYVGKCDALNAAAETVLLATQPDKNDFNGSQVNMVFTRPFQSLMPYNGSDNQETGYLPDGSEWFYAAFSFLSNDTVRYAVYSPLSSISGIVDGNSSKQNFSGFITIGAGFGNLPQYNVFGTVRASMFINQAFTTQTDMENLYNDIISGPVTNLGL